MQDYRKLVRVAESACSRAGELMRFLTASLSQAHDTFLEGSTGARCDFDTFQHRRGCRPKF